MNLPKLTELNVSGKRVLVRMDLDLSEGDLTRLEVGGETLDFLKQNGAEIIVIGHRGRPSHEATAGEADRDKLSLKPFQPFFDKWGARLEENLRFDLGEEKNDTEFAKKLASLGDIYINESFANSHRNHASIVGLPKLLPHAAGFRFIKEVENISKVSNPSTRDAVRLSSPPKSRSGRGRPVVILISGIKKDKVEMARRLSEKFDKVLVGGRLPEYFGDEGLVSVRARGNGEKLIVGNLIQDKEDITPNTIEVFKGEIAKAGTIVLAGVLGKYEDEGHRQGTKEIFEAVAASSAYKIAGGGDTEAAITILSLSNGFDWISVGGGAMLEFLASGTLPGIEAIKFIDK